MSCIGCETYAKRITNIFRDEELKAHYEDLTSCKILYDCFICDDCLKKLESSYTFKHQCIEIHRKQEVPHYVAENPQKKVDPETMFVLNEIVEDNSNSQEKSEHSEFEEFIVSEITCDNDEVEYEEIQYADEIEPVAADFKAEESQIIKRKSYTVQEKLQIIQYAEENSNRQAARFHDINESTVRCFRRHKETLLMMNPKRKTNRRANPHWPHLEENLKKFVSDQASQTGKGVPLKEIKKEAFEIASRLGISNFNGTNSYIFKFMQRHKLPCASPRPRKKIKIEN